MTRAVRDLDEMKRLERGRDAVSASDGRIVTLAAASLSAAAVPMATDPVDTEMGDGGRGDCAAIAVRTRPLNSLPDRMIRRRPGVYSGDVGDITSSLPPSPVPPTPRSVRGVLATDTPEIDSDDGMCA
jgi:hypothetical protein